MLYINKKENMVLQPSEIEMGLWRDRGLVKAYLD